MPRFHSPGAGFTLERDEAGRPAAWCRCTLADHLVITEVVDYDSGTHTATVCLSEALERGRAVEALRSALNVLEAS